MVEEFKLSNKFSVYKTKYNGNYSKENFIKRVIQNKSILVKNSKSIDEKRFIIECTEFKELDKFIISILEKIENQKVNNIAKFSWIYTQDKNETMTDMHKHDYLLYTTEKTSIETEWTCVFYIQMPNNLKNDEGNIVFMTEDKNIHKFIPKENDILLFSGKLHHMIIPMPNAEMDRIVYATNFNLNIK